MFLLDTNVLSELRKLKSGKAAAQVGRWADAVPAEMQFVSVIVLQEIEIGILLKERSDPRQSAILRKWMSEQLLPAFAGRILGIDLTIAVRAAGLHVPDPRPVRDALIAATALSHGLKVATRNVTDFAGTGVQIVNPWDF